MSFKRGKTYGPNKMAYSLGCEWCGCGFRSARPETNCCSNAHKLRYHRWLRAYAIQFGSRPECGPRGNTERQNWFKRFAG